MNFYLIFCYCVMRAPLWYGPWVWRKSGNYIKNTYTFYLYDLCWWIASFALFVFPVIVRLNLEYVIWWLEKNVSIILMFVVENQNITLKTQKLNIGCLKSGIFRSRKDYFIHTVMIYDIYPPIAQLILVS